MTPMSDFLYQALLGFSAMVFLIWVLPGAVHRQDDKGDDRKHATHPRLKTHP